jgi:hypothetical protein
MPFYTPFTDREIPQWQDGLVMKTQTNITLTALVLFTTLSFAKPAPDPRINTTTPKVDPPAVEVNDGENRIQIAILLDTSSSMDGLIDQAKTQLWKVVNTFIEAKRDGKAPFVEVALYEYGNNNNAAGNDWIRLVSPMTRDLDQLSRDLFALKTNGGEEYCGAVVQRALGDLAWDTRETTYKAIFIAGNEPFTQGRVDARSVCKDALGKGIVVNTIHCGNRQQGIDGAWHDGAALGGGEFLVIDQDAAVAHIDAPQDQRISELSRKLNDTYIGYGKRREEAAANQKMADDDAAANAKSGAAVERAVCKASGNYSNAGWDLVDATRENKIDPATLKPEELPDELKAIAPGQRKAFIEEKAKERAAIQEEIQNLNKEREAHLVAEMKKNAEGGAVTLDKAMIEATRKQAAKLGYEFAN